MSESKLIQFGTIWDAESKAGKPYHRLNFLRSKNKFPVFSGTTKGGVDYKGVYVGRDDVGTLIKELEETIDFLKNEDLGESFLEQEQETKF